MLSRLASSPGKSLFIRSFAPHPIISPTPSPDPQHFSHLSPAVQNSVLFPELATFTRILTILQDSKADSFEVFQGPIRLRQKVLTRLLLSSHQQSTSNTIDLSSLESYLSSDFHTNFKNQLRTQGFSPDSEVTAFVESLRSQFDSLGQDLNSNERSSWKSMILLQLLLNIGIFAFLFYTTYFWKDWEVVEPISYLNLVFFNLVYFASLIYSRKISGSQVKIFNSKNVAKLVRRRQKYSLNRKRFETFYYEYNEILRNLN